VNSVASQMSAGRLMAAYLGDIRFEFTKMIRTPAFALPTLLFPAMFYLLFGVIMGSAKGNGLQALYSFATLSVFGTMAPGLFGFGVSLAFEREYGLLVFKQALPMPPGAYLLARMAMAMIFATIISLLLIVLAKFAGHVPLSFAQGLKVYLIGVFGVLPFCAIGLCVGAFVSGQAAPAIVNVIYLPMSFLSGLWVPLPILPHVLQQIAPIWPSFHLAQLSLDTLGAASMGTILSHIAALAGITIVFFVIALRRLSSGGLRLFGGTNGARNPKLPLQRMLSRAVFFAAIGAIVVGFMGGRVQNAAHDAGGPVGVAAPGTPVIATFDDGTAKAAYGLGWNDATDRTQGGNSSAAVQVVADGAEHSKGALEVKGTIGDAAQYPFAGTAFWPKGSTAEDALVDYSNRHFLKFFARGDGRQYTVIFLVKGTGGGIPPMYSFTPGADWQEVSIKLGTLAGMDLRRVRAILVGSMGPTGDFQFRIDNVRLE
jgi:ABC-2 type transport system permease protein